MLERRSLISLHAEDAKDTPEAIRSLRNSGAKRHDQIDIVVGPEKPRLVVGQLNRVVEQKPSVHQEQRLVLDGDVEGAEVWGSGCGGSNSAMPIQETGRAQCFSDWAPDLLRLGIEFSLRGASWIEALSQGPWSKMLCKTPSSDPPIDPAEFPTMRSNSLPKSLVSGVEVNHFVVVFFSSSSFSSLFFLLCVRV